MIFLEAFKSISYNGTLVRPYWLKDNISDREPLMELEIRNKYFIGMPAVS